MKKNITVLLLVIILGVFSGKYLYTKLSVYAFNNKIDNMVYMLQLGVYPNKNELYNDTKNINNKLIIKKGNNYYVYVGISKDKDNLKKIANIYNNLGYNLYIKEQYISDEYFMKNLNQFDLLLKSCNTNDEINSINAVVLSSYEENILKK